MAQGPLPYGACGSVYVCLVSPACGTSRGAEQWQYTKPATNPRGTFQQRVEADGPMGREKLSNV